MLNKLLLSLFLLVSTLLASEVDLCTPSSTVISYNNAMNDGDIDALKQIMVKSSFDTDMQVYALSIALKNPNFHIILKEYSKSDEARQIVIKEVKQKLYNRKKRTIVIDKEVAMGKDRVMVKFFEHSKQKQLYLEKKDKVWKINYLAGRKTN